MKQNLSGLLVAIALLLSISSTGGFAKTLRWANDGDVNSMDPYARQETFLLAFTSSFYEPLVRRNQSLKLEPALATDWKLIAPTTWRFSLRQGVKFSDGSAFSADDVVFSYNRAIGSGSNIQGLFIAVKDVRKVDDLTIDIETKGPYAILADDLTNWGIMSKAWCEKHGTIQAANMNKGEESFATRNAMGTGPFILKSREPDVKTVLVPNPNWWDKPVHNLDEVVFQRIANASTRVAALRSGEIDLIYTVPPQDIAGLKRADGIKVWETPETRTIFLGFDQVRDELTDSDIKGKNPFKDLRVRKAFWMAIDNEAIKQRVMRGQAQTIALMWGPLINGYDKSIDIRPPYDPQAAKALLTEAGYPDGFRVTLDCPNDRYVNDEAICQAVASMLAKIGVKIDLRAQTKAKYFAQVGPPAYTTSFFLQGWTPSSMDSLNVLNSLMQTRDGKTIGINNYSGYSNPAIDALINKASVETDPVKRLVPIREAAILHRDDVGHIPLHTQYVVWATRSNIEPAISGNNYIQLRLIRVN